MIRDGMHPFELFQPASVGEALDLMARYGRTAWTMAGGQDSLDWFKDRVKQPRFVIDLSGIDNLKGIRETDDGIEIGALTPLAEVERDAVIRERYGLLADAVGHVASPQIRNQGTIGGNVCQDTRCWYYRSGLECYRADGDTCFAAMPQAMNREHCLFGAARCVAVSPSDVAPALVALDASMVVRSAEGERVVPSADFFIGPSVDITRMTVLDPGDLLTSIRIPSAWAGARFYFEKVADRNVWDFALVNVAAALRVMPDGSIGDVRIVCGAVECVPRRLVAVEDAIRGEVKHAETGRIAGRIATRGAVPLNYNHFKIPLMQNLVMRAIRDS